MQSRNDEIELFKSQVNLAELAASYGFARDAVKSTRHTYSMQDGQGNHLVISVNPATGHWRWFNPVAPEESGTVIDFVQHMEQVNLGEVRKILRHRLAMPSPGLTDYVKPAAAVKKDPKQVTSFLKRFKPAADSEYAKGRGIARETLTALQFKGRVLQGYKGALIFPHFDQLGICGYEVKAPGLTSFSSMGTKCLWVSRVPRTVNQVVVCESGVEVLSYRQANQPAGVVYVSTAGNWSAHVDERIQALAARYPHSEFVGAFNNDKGGQRLAARLHQIVASAGARYRDHFPPEPGMDWNDWIKRGT
ncbi:MAG: DUF3991 and toprim domain-containing protein [Marinobacter sp.]|nr:DUF3991 and toprim domain-containing protein [Marinobacter sp.]